MAPPSKFGTFGGVFTPSVLTILGVIMYLRLPWVVGNAGLFAALGIILVAHVISITTGLSISSVATDKRVGVGGPYFIVSRSFGLPIGGAIGLALFIGLSFSISLYIIGFSESFLGFLGQDISPTTIRICGTITIIALSAVTLISTSFAIKTQYVILVLIAASLVSIFLGGGSTAASGSELASSESGPSLALLFGIFFPAVTGFTAGVNMSGDLRDPKRAIPIGTMLAVGVGFVVYIVLAIFLGTRVDSVALRENPNILQDIALFGPAVIAGIWGATLSSALGSILGAPRILQAMSADRITPRFFARGYGPTREPRNALILAFAIGEAGILIAELDVIARVVSMIFLTMYGVVNLVCAIESWVSPDFRPTFRIPHWVGLIGAATCLLLMIQLDLLAMAGATVIMAGLYVWLTRRQLALESGDTWEGVWAAMVRAGLHRLGMSRHQQRNWRPNVLAFYRREDDHSDGWDGDDGVGPLRALAASLTSGSGIVTEIELTSEASARRDGADPDKVGVFHRTVASEAPFETIRTLCQHHGFTGLAPNTVMLPWSFTALDPVELGSTVGAAARANLNIMLFDPRRQPAPTASTGARQPPTIDLWWSESAGNLTLGVAILRFMSRATRYSDATIRVQLALSDPRQTDALRAQTLRALSEARVEATVHVVVPTRSVSVDDLIVEHSTSADVVLVGLPPSSNEGLAQASIARLERIAALPGGVVFFHANNAFPEILRTSSVAMRVRTEERLLDASEVALPSDPKLAEVATSFQQESLQVFKNLTNGFLEPGYKTLSAFVDRVAELESARFARLLEIVRSEKPENQILDVEKNENEFLTLSRTCLSEFLNADIAGDEARMHGALETLTAAAHSVAAFSKTVRTRVPRGRFSKSASDDSRLAAWKRRRLGFALGRRNLSVRVPTAHLCKHHFYSLADDVQAVLAQFQRESHNTLIEIAQLIANASRPIQSIAFHAASVAEREQLVNEASSSASAELDAMQVHISARLEADIASATQAVAIADRALSEDLRRIDARRLARERPLARAFELPGTAREWAHRQRAVVERALLGLQIAEVRLRLIAVAHGADEELGAQATAAEHEIEQSKTPSTELARRGDGATRRDNGGPTQTMSKLARISSRLVSKLPEAVASYTDASWPAMARAAWDTVETTELSVKRRLGILVDSHFIAPVSIAIEHYADVVKETSLLSQTVKDAQTSERAIAESRGRESKGAVALRQRSIARLTDQEAELHSTLASARSAIDAGLSEIYERTRVFELERSLAERRSTEARAGIAARASDQLRRGLDKTRAIAARAVYRRSEGVVFAKSLLESDQEISAHRQLRDCVDACAVKAEVEAKIPRYYRHLFTSDATLPEGLWVGRQRTIERGLEALDSTSSKRSSVVLVSGERRSGKSALCVRLGAAAGGEPLWLSAPTRGRADIGGVTTAFRRALGGSGSAMPIEHQIPDGALVIVDDLEFYWERRAGGLAGIDELLRIIAATDRSVRFVLVASSRSLRLLSQLRPINQVARQTLHCGPLAAVELQKVILARHRATGLRFQLGKRHEADVKDWTMARLFDRYFEYSKGNVGFALRTWLAHIDSFEDETIQIRTPSLRGWGGFDELPSQLSGLTAELLLRKAASEPALSRICGDIDYLRNGLATLENLGIAVRNHQLYAIRDSVVVPLARNLETRGLS